MKEKRLVEKKKKGRGRKSWLGEREGRVQAKRLVREGKGSEKKVG